MKIKTFFLNYWKSILVAFIILYLCFAPPSTFESVPSFPHADKIVHFFMFLFLTLILQFDFKKKYGLYFNRLPYVMICLILPIVLGGLIEVLQGLFFSRSADFFDWLVDIAGVIAAWIIMQFWFRKMRSQKNSSKS